MMARPLWSRAVVGLVALIASLMSPGLAVAHGIAHAHLAESHHAPALAAADHHQHEHVDAHDELLDHHRPVTPTHPEYPSAHEPDHGHGHEHATVAAAISTRADFRTAVDTPIVYTPVSATLVQSGQLTRPAASWDCAALARPAPHSGPPPAPRAPPAR